MENVDFSLRCNQFHGFKRKKNNNFTSFSAWIIKNKSVPQYKVHHSIYNNLDNWTEDDEYNHYTYGDWEVTANRARFQHSSLENTSIKFQAMTSVKTELAKIVFNSSDDTSNVQQHPIAYTLM